MTTPSQILITSPKERNYVTPAFSCPSPCCILTTLADSDNAFASYLTCTRSAPLRRRKLPCLFKASFFFATSSPSTSTSPCLAIGSFNPFSATTCPRRDASNSNPQLTKTYTCFPEGALNYATHQSRRWSRHANGPLKKSTL